MEISLKGKTVLITGGVRGIGRAMTEAAAKAGAQVIATYLSNEAAANDFVQGLKSQHLNVHACKLDVRDAQQVDEALTVLESEYGPVHVLINNAGIVKDELILGMENESWNDVINTNLGGAFHVTRAVARQMVRARKGQIINISSVAASLLSKREAMVHQRARVQSRMGEVAAAREASSTPASSSRARSRLPVREAMRALRRPARSSLSAAALARRAS